MTSRRSNSLLPLVAALAVVLGACTGPAATTPAAASPTAAVSEAATEAATEATTEAATEAATEATTVAATEPATEAATEAATEGSPGATGGSPGTGYTGPIEWWQLGYTPGGASQLVDDAVAGYEGRNPGVDITVTGLPFSDEGLARLDTALATEQGPDIFRIASDRLPQYVEQGVLSPIDPYLTEEDRADILPNLLEGVEINGEHYAWPQWVPPVGFYLNRAIFEEAGVEVPDENWTVDEFKEIAQQLTGDDVFGFATYMGVASVNELTLLYTEGATVLSDDNSEYTLNSEAGVRGLQTLVDLFEAGAMPPDITTLALADVDQGFADGRFGIITGGSGGITTFKEAGVDFVVLPPPIGAAGEHVTVGGMGTYAIPARQGDEARIAAAHDLARYLTSAEVLEDVPGWYLAPASRRSISVAEQTPEMAAFEEMLPFVRFMPLIPEWSQIDAAIHPEIQLAVSGQKTPEQALEDAGAAIEPLLGE